MDNAFYHAFEARYRGDRALVLERLCFYLPVVRELLGAPIPSAAIDLGCGRGEWLELLTAEGFVIHGVDSDAAMLAECRQRQLAVVEADALDYLQQQAPGSLALVTAFHLVEHLPFDRLMALIATAHRMLMPGGLLILETPNPENLEVAALKFWLDPTHQRPLPPLLLAFLPEYVGFPTVATLRMQGDDDLLRRETVSMADIVTGVSHDYAVVACKAGGEPPAALAALAAEHGVSLLSGLQRLREVEAASAASTAAFHATTETTLREHEKRIGELVDRVQVLDASVWRRMWNLLTGRRQRRRAQSGQQQERSAM